FARLETFELLVNLSGAGIFVIPVRIGINALGTQSFKFSSLLCAQYIFIDGLVLWILIVFHFEIPYMKGAERKSLLLLMTSFSKNILNIFKKLDRLGFWTLKGISAHYTTESTTFSNPAHLFK